MDFGKLLGYVVCTGPAGPTQIKRTGERKKFFSVFTVPIDRPHGERQTGGILMAANPKKDQEKKEQGVMEQLWLTYYNDSLYNKGVITEEQHNKMRLKILSRAKLSHT